MVHKLWFGFAEDVTPERFLQVLKIQEVAGFSSDKPFRLFSVDSAF